MKLFRKTDLIVVLVVFAVAAGGWALMQAYSKDTPAQAELYLGAKKELTVPLASGEPRTFSLPERPGVVLELTEDGAVRFVSSDCPDQVCVRAGKLHTPGQSAACLPNEVIVKIVAADGSRNDGPDLIVG